MKGALFVITLALTVGCKDGQDGPQGAQGDPGADGNEGLGGDPGTNGDDAPDTIASLVAVLPSQIAAGETTRLTILGDHTAWDETTTVDLGEDVTVNAVDVGSATWISVIATAAPEAPAGARDVTVATGDAELSLAGGLQVGALEAPMTINLVSLDAGAWAAVAIRSAEPVFDQFTVVEICDADNPGKGGACTPAAGFAWTGPSVIDPQLVYFVIRLDLFMPNGNAELVVTTREGRTALPVPYYETTPPGIAMDEETVGNLPADNTFDAYAVDVAEPGRLILDLEVGDPEAFASPHIEILDLLDGVTARWEIVGDRLAVPITNPGTYYVVVSDDWQDGRVAGGEDFTYTITPSVASFGIFYQGTIEAEGEVDRYDFAPGVDTILTVETGPGPVEATSIGDTILRVLDDADVELAMNDDVDLWGGDYYSRIDAFSFTAGQTYHITVEGFCGGGCATGDYTLLGY